jgi:hypothetical protein
VAKEDTGGEFNSMQCVQDIFIWGYELESLPTKNFMLRPMPVRTMGPRPGLSFYTAARRGNAVVACGGRQAGLIREAAGLAPGIHLHI